MHFYHFRNHIRTVLSELSSMILILSGKRKSLTLPFSCHIYCVFMSGVVCFLLLLGTLGRLSIVVALRGRLFQLYDSVKVLQGCSRKGL